MCDGDVEIRGGEQIADVIDSDAEQPGPKGARGLRRGGRDTGGDVRGGGAINARGLADPQSELHGRRHTGAAHAVQGHVDRAVGGDVEREESEPADRQRPREGLAHRWSRPRGGAGAARRGGRRRRRTVTAGRTEKHQSKNRRNRSGGRPHAFHSTISKSVTGFS